MTDPKALTVLASLLKTAQDTITAHRKIYDAVYEAGLQDGLAKLDQAWAEIDALGRDLGKPDSYTDGFAHAISMALGKIEKLGGMDPAKRGKECSQLDVVAQAEEAIGND